MIIGLLISFCFGYIFGVIEAWNKVVFFWLLFTLVVLFLISLLIYESNHVESELDLLKIFLGSISTFVGMRLGRFNYDIIKE